jgi:hypothetical protein
VEIKIYPCKIALQLFLTNQVGFKESEHDHDWYKYISWIFDQEKSQVHVLKAMKYKTTSDKYDLQNFSDSVISELLIRVIEGLEMRLI